MDRRALAPALVAAALAVPHPASARTRVLLETDPATFALGGFGAHARVVPGGGHLAVGGGAYALNFPGILVDMDSSNRGAGWNVRLTLGGAVFGDYSFRPGGEAWFVGVEAAVQEYRYTNGNVAGEADATNLVLMPRFGYLWRPFDAGFFLMPWAGLGVQSRVAGSSQVGGRTYDLFPLIPYGAVHLGWLF